MTSTDSGDPYDMSSVLPAALQVALTGIVSAHKAGNTPPGLEFALVRVSEWGTGVQWENAFAAGNARVKMRATGMRVGRGGVKTFVKKAYIGRSGRKVLFWQPGQ